MSVCAPRWTRVGVTSEYHAVVFGVKVSVWIRTSAVFTVSIVQSATTVPRAVVAVKRRPLPLTAPLPGLNGR